MPLSGHAERHSSEALSSGLIHEADLLYCMTEAHRQAVIRMVPSAESKAQLLDPEGDIGDPIGSGPPGYQKCAKLIRRLIDQRLKEHRL